ITISEMDAGIGMGDPVEIQLNGPEHEVLRELADDVVDGIQTVDGVHNPESEANLGVPQLQLEVDDDKAALYGLSVEEIQSQIEMAGTGEVVNVYREDGKEKDVSLAFPEETRETIKDLEDVKVQSADGASVQLTELAAFYGTQGPVTLIRR